MVLLSASVERFGVSRMGTINCSATIMVSKKHSENFNLFNRLDVARAVL